MNQLITNDYISSVLGKDAAIGQNTAVVFSSVFVETAGLIVQRK